MDKELAIYIITHFSHLLTLQERMAVRHMNHMYTIEYSNVDSEKITKLYQKIGWLSTDQNVLNLLTNYDAYQIKVANRILEENPGKVFINTCPNCHKLARTPLARQCRYCGYSWHEN